MSHAMMVGRATFRLRPEQHGSGIRREIVEPRIPIAPLDMFLELQERLLLEADSAKVMNIDLDTRVLEIECTSSGSGECFAYVYRGAPLGALSAALHFVQNRPEQASPGIRSTQRGLRSQLDKLIEQEY